MAKIFAVNTLVAMMPTAVMLTVKIPDMVYHTHPHKVDHYLPNQCLWPAISQEWMGRWQGSMNKEGKLERVPWFIHNHLKPYLKMEKRISLTQLHTIFNRYIYTL